MPRSPQPLVSVCVSLLLACGGRTVSESASSGSGESGADTGAMNADTNMAEVDSGPEEEAGETDVGPCEENSDCPGDEICVQGECGLWCGEAEVVFDSPNASIAWVVDRSNSMRTLSWDDDGDPATPNLARWAAAHTFISEVSEARRYKWSFGLSLFPGDSACDNDDEACHQVDACTVDSQLLVLPDQYSNDTPEEVLPLLPPANADENQLRGGSPVVEALYEAAEGLISVSRWSSAIVLVSDGGANCGTFDCNGPGACPMLEDYDASVVAAIADIQQRLGVQTLVVGVDAADTPDDTSLYDTPEADRLARLQAMAVAGGWPAEDGQPYRAEDIEGFLQWVSNLDQDEVWSCEVDLSLPPNTIPDPSQVDLIDCYVGSEETPVPYRPEWSYEDCQLGDEPGWRWVTDGITMQFCGDVCPELNAFSWEMHCYYGCPL